MYRLLLVFLLVPAFLWSQEQVSDIDQYGVYDPTDFSRQLGFALINGEHYMLQENDSLTIYKWSGTRFDELHVVPQFHEQELSSPNNTLPDVKANRSLLSISNGNYYRFLENGVQVINIETGTVEAEYNGAEQGWTSVFPRGLYEDKVHFTVNRLSEYLSLVIDGSTMTLDSFPRSFQTATLIGDTYFGYSSGRVYATNLAGVTDSLVAELGNGSQGAAVSEVDKTLVVVDEAGDVWQVGWDLIVTKTPCNVSDYTGYHSHLVDGSSLIAIYTEDQVLYRVVVYDISTGMEQQQFNIEPGISNVYYFNLVQSETPDDRYSIFGVNRWTDATGGIDNGAYYIIDHQNKSSMQLPEVNTVRSYSPFVKDDNLYFEVYTARYLTTISEYLARYNMTTQEYVQLVADEQTDIGDGQDATVAFGFPLDSTIIVATNTRAETAQVWKLDLQDSFTYVQTLDYLDNLGMLNIKDVVPMSDRIYFSNNGGVYSVLHDTKQEIPFTNVELNQSFIRDTRLSGYQDKLTYLTFDVDHVVFNVLDANTGQEETFTEPGPRNSLYNVRGAGPFSFYINDLSANAQYFDSKTNTFDVVPGLTMIDPSLITAGNNKVLLRDSRNLVGAAKLYMMDYESNAIDELEINIYASVIDIRAADGAFYLYDRNSSPDSIRLRVIEDNGQLTGLYTGRGSHRSSELHAYDPESGVTFYNFRDSSGDAVIVANDLEQTDVVHIDNSQSTKILDVTRDVLVLEGDDSLRVNRYLVYRAFNPVQEVVLDKNAYVTFVDSRDSVTVFLYMNRGESFVTQHNFYNNTTTTTKVGDFNVICHDYIRIDDNRYLIDMASSNAIDALFEPWVLNMESLSLERLSDLNPGLELESPHNLLQYKSWVYFTAIMEGKGRQWFRLGTGPGSNTLELIAEPLLLTPYPNPSAGIFRLDRNLVKLSIYNMAGQVVKELETYSQSQAIDILDQPTGVFQMIGFDEKGQRYQGQLVKVKK